MAQGKGARSKLPEIHYEPEEISDVAKSCPAYARLTNNNHKQFVLAWIDHSQLGPVAIAKALKRHEKSVRNWLNDDKVANAIRQVSLIRANFSDAKCCAVLAFIVDKIAEKVINDKVDAGDLSKFEQEVLLTGRNRVIPAQVKLKKSVSEGETVEELTTSMDSLLAQSFGDDPIDVN